MTPLLAQHVKEVFGYGDGDLRHSPLGLVTGMGLDSSGLPPFDTPARLLVRSPANATEVDKDHVVGMVLPKVGTIDTIDGTAITSSEITEASAYWAEHEIIMVDGTQQGHSRRISTSAVGGLTLRAAFDSDPDPGDAFQVMPQRVTGLEPLAGHENEAFYYYAVRNLSPMGILGRVSRPLRVEFTAGGAIRSNAPNPVRTLHAQQKPSGKFELTWHYPVQGQGGYPKDFRVYGDAGTGTIDYGTPLTDSETGLTYVLYRAHGIVYSFLTGEYADGLGVKFAVVARNADEAEQVGGGTVSNVVEAMATPPPPPAKFEPTDPIGAWG